MQGIQKEFKQIIRQPFYILLFVLAEFISIYFPLQNMDSLREIPSLIYFVMGFSLLFMLYGAERARYDYQTNIAELMSTLPKGVSYYFQKAVAWFLFSFFGMFSFSLRHSFM